jgi:hypothetical protein
MLARPVWRGGRWQRPCRPGSEPALPPPSASEGIHRAAHTAAAAVEDVGVDHGRADVRVAQEPLDGPDVVAGLDEVRGEGVPRVWGVAGLARRTRRTVWAMAFWTTVSCRWWRCPSPSGAGLRDGRCSAGSSRRTLSRSADCGAGCAPVAADRASDLLAQATTAVAGPVRPEPDPERYPYVSASCWMSLRMPAAVTSAPAPGPVTTRGSAR